MNIKTSDFIEMYSEVFPEGFCKHLIENFQHHKNSGAGGDRRSLENAPAQRKDDYAMFYDVRIQNILDFEGQNSFDIFWESLQKSYDQYSEKFSILKNCNIKAHEIKMQEISSGQGYHIWHHEKDSSPRVIRRCLTYMVYLNTLPDEANGETEFLYQQRRIKPVENTLVIWPADFTHPHRGNPVYGEATKYIVTGWFEYT